MSAETEWRHSARSTWEKLVQAGYQEWLLPIIPPWARLPSGSHLVAGKMPGLRMDDGTYVGFKNWQRQPSTAGDIARYASWPDCPCIGFRLGMMLAFDMDLKTEGDQRSRSLSATVQNLIKQWMGDLSLRTRPDSTRWAALFAADVDARDVAKHVYIFKEAATGVVLGKLELLANGQQVVVAGVHPDGALWNWPIMPMQSLPRVNRTQIAMLGEALPPTLALMGIAVEHGKKTGIYALESTAAIGDSSLMASIPDLLWQAMRCIDNSKIENYDDFFTLFRAIKAACGGREDFFEQAVLPWALAWPANTPEWVRDKWNSITDSNLGAGYVERIARKWGYRGPPISNDFDPMEDGAVKPVDDINDWLEGEPSNASNMPKAPAPADSGLPFPVQDTIDDATLVETFKKAPGCGTHHIYLDDIGEWTMYQDTRGVWTFDRKGQKAQSKALTFLKGFNVNKLISIHRARELIHSLSGSHCTTVNEFDTDPMLINTPSGIADLRPGGSMRPHHPGERFRFQAGVAPLPGDPVFFNQCVLEWADDDADLALSYVSLGASLLLGDPPSGWLANLYGERLNGKSTFVKLMQRILGNYASQATPGVIAARHSEGDKPRADLVVLHKSRMVFVPEMSRKHLTTDVIKAWTGGDGISARQMYDPTMKVITPGRLIVLSNHRLDYEDDDPAMNARLRVIPFPRTFERDDSVQKRLLAEAPQIFNLLIDTVRETQGHLHLSDAVKMATEDVLDEIAPSRRLARAALDCSRAYVNAPPLTAAEICQHLRAAAQEQFASDAPVAGMALLDDAGLLGNVLKAVSGQYWRIRQRKNGVDTVTYKGIKLRPLMSEWIDK